MMPAPIAPPPISAPEADAALHAGGSCARLHRRRPCRSPHIRPMPGRMTLRPRPLPRRFSRRSHLTCRRHSQGPMLGHLSIRSELPPTVGSLPDGPPPVTPRMPPRLNPAPLPMPRRDGGRQDTEPGDGLSSLAPSADAGLAAAGRSRPPPSPPPLVSQSLDADTATVAAQSAIAAPRSGPPPLPAIAPAVPREPPPQHAPAQPQGTSAVAPAGTVAKAQSQGQPSGQAPGQIRVVCGSAASTANAAADCAAAADH